jgi:glyoxylase-like metal-dependent hydrolase (beta-lactamase superfamily II)
MTVIANNENICIESLVLGPYSVNTYKLVCPRTKESVVIDAPDEAGRVIEWLSGTNLKYILMTHNHRDHTGALEELVGELKVPVAANSHDAPKLPVTPQLLLNDNDTVSFGNVKLKVMHTPGHTPGGLCFLSGKYLISGDTLFNGGPGRTGSPADLKQLLESITKKIFVLPDDTGIYPGHGEATVVKQAKEEFAVFAAKTHDPNLSGDVVWLTT